ncbi:Ig-like domain-containing protein, partial [Bradyrhizobium sp. NBAIM08]|uniref:Ig-like domain-containing protein n=1 Tax=Bradyrhizobium sp. NBAIM08 TaxID=2793815 RepID=UPI001CD3372F
ADPATVDEESFLLSGPGGAPVPASVSYDASTRTATLTPDEPLGLMSAYTARVTDGVRGLDGAALDASAWIFTTAITPPAGPAVTAATPAADATDVSNASSVSAAFDRPLDPATVTAQSFTLTPDGGQPVAATVAYDAVTHEAT